MATSIDACACRGDKRFCGPNCTDEIIAAAPRLPCFKVRASPRRGSGLRVGRILVGLAEGTHGGAAA